MQSMKPATVDEYLRSLPVDQRKALEHIRSTVKKIVPDVTEKISYGMPTFFHGHALVGYAAFKNHCSFFPWSSKTLKSFTKELAEYQTSAGTVRFTTDKPIPVSLIKKIVIARLIEHAEKEALRNEKKNKKKGTVELPTGLAAPARRALDGAAIKNLNDLTKRRQSEISALHGMGPKALGMLRTELKREGLSFKK